MNPAESLQYLTTRLNRLRNFMLFGHTINGLSLLLIALSALFVLAFAFNAVFYLSTTFRMIFVSLAALLLVGILGAAIIWRFVKKPSTEAVALQVETKYPQLQDRLIASLQLERNLQQNPEGFSADMIRAVMMQSEEMCREFDFKKSVDQSFLKRSLRWLGISAFAVIMLGFIFPGPFNNTLYLFANPTIEVPRDLGYRLDVNPKDAEIAKFSPITIEAILVGRNMPPDARLHWRYEDGPVKTEALEKQRVARGVASGIAGKLAGDDSTILAFEFREVRRSFEYWVSAGEIESETYKIEAVDKPRIIDIKLSYIYPKYTGLQPLVIDENDGNISAIKGTLVKVEATANKPPQTAELVMKDGKQSPLDISSHRLNGEIRVMEEGSYHIAISDDLGNVNPDPIEYRIAAIADAFPEADLFAPGVPVNLGDDMALDLGVKLFDDFGFSSLKLHYRIYSPRGESFAQSLPVPLGQSAGKNLEVRYPWDLSDIGLEPGGFVEYYFEVYDNDAVTGPKKAMSQLLVARLPSIDEQFAYLEDEGESQIADLEKLRETQEELLENTQKLQEELLSNQQMDWEKKQQIQKSIQSQQQMFDQMEQIKNRLEQMEEQMRKNDMTSLEILQKLQELKKLFDEVATPEMKEAMRKMQEALEKMSPEEMQKAAEEMQLSQEELKELLDRQIALMKFLQAQQKMENMMRRLAELIENQERVNQQTEQASSDQLPKMAPQEQANKEQFDQLKKDADELEQMLKDLNLDKQPDAQAFMDESRKSDAGEEMQQMTEQMKQQQKQPAQKSGEQALESLKKMQQNMQQQKDSFNQSQGQMSAEKMREAANDMLYMSEKQEDVYDRAEQSDPSSLELQQLAAEQQALQRTMKSLDEKLKEIGKQSPFLNKQVDELMRTAQQCMNQSTEHLLSRDGANAMRSQKDAMFSLNQAANQMMQSMQNQSMCNSGSCNNENMFKKMNKLSQQQKQLNNQTKGMCDKPGQANPKQGELGRLAAQQGAVQKSLQDLQREQGNRKEILGRLDELAKETQKVIEDLEGGNVGEQTFERQHKIYQRMLDFQRSLERQDFSEERKAEVGRDIQRASPEQLQFEAASKQNFQDRLQKFMNEGYPPEYEELIKEYFRSVNSGAPPQK